VTEVLVAFGIIIVLLGITVPIVSHIRREAFKAQQQQLQQQLQQQRQQQGVGAGNQPAGELP
jgi:type II secretory pathway pseudopilin PulG